MDIRERFDESAIVDRPDWSWPDGKRMAFYVALNIEHTQPDCGFGHSPTSAVAGYDTRNFAWREYGMRVGFWNILAVADRYGIPISHIMNAEIVREHPRVAEEVKRRGDEVIAHGRSNAEKLPAMTSKEECEMVFQSKHALETFLGRPVNGWLSPWILESPETLDYLKEAGFRFVLDWPMDDQPFPLHTEFGDIVSIPYSIEVNDTPSMLARRDTADDFLAMFKRQFDMCVKMSERYPLAFGFPLHTFAIGQPFRLAVFEEILAYVAAHPAREQVWVTRPTAILEAYEQATKK